MANDIYQCTHFSTIFLKNDNKKRLSDLCRTALLTICINYFA